MKKIILLLTFILCFNVVYADNLILTKIDTKKDTIQIEFNNVLQLSNFKLIDNNLISPFYEKNNNKYYFFYFLDRNFKNAIINSVKNKDKININGSVNKIEYKINKCSLVKSHKNILAFMSVIFNSNIEINCNLLNGKYGLWIAWPALKEKDKWNKVFDIKDKKLKEEIETKLIKHYKQKKNANELKK